jgi:hypothetical protein
MRPKALDMLLSFYFMHLILPEGIKLVVQESCFSGQLLLPNVT